MRFLCFICTCNQDGIIKKIILNNIVGSTIKQQDRFLSMFDRENLDKAQRFLLDLKLTDTLLESELVVGAFEKPLLLYFKGVREGDEWLIMGESDFDDLLQFYSGLMKLNNRLINIIRNLHKSSTAARDGGTDQIMYLDELTKVNNELISTQRELSKKNAELAKLNALKNQFVGMAAHDLRNPLGIIKSYCSFLLEEEIPGLSGTNRDFLEIIHSTSIYMLSLVEGILDLTYIQSGKVRLNREWVDFAELINQTIPLYRSLSSKKNIRIESFCNLEKSMISIDTIKIRQVISNLIGNAIKYSPPDTLIEVNTRNAGDTIEVCVRDQGYGVPAQDLERIFDPFTRSSLLVDGTEASSGLGLAITKNIVLAHQGRIWVESQVEKGSSFYFCLPLNSI